MAYYFYVKTKILVDFQICISVPLTDSTKRETHCIVCLKFNQSYLQFVFTHRVNRQNLSILMYLTKLQSNQKNNQYHLWSTTIAFIIIRSLVFIKMRVTPLVPIPLSSSISLEEETRTTNFLCYPAKLLKMLWTFFGVFVQVLVTFFEVVK